MLINKNECNYLNSAIPKKWSSTGGVSDILDQSLNLILDWVLVLRMLKPQLDPETGTGAEKLLNGILNSADQ